MADYRVTDTELTSIANAIRTKGATQASLEFPTGFVTAIENIPTGREPVLQSKTATENGTVTPDQGYDGLSSVVVNVSQASPTIDVLYSQQSGHTLANPWSYTGTIQHSGKLIVSLHAYSGSTKFILNGVEKPLDVSGVEYTYGLNAIFDVNAGDTINTYSNMSGKSDGGIIVVLVY